MFKDKKGISLIAIVLIVVAIIVVGIVATILVINKGNDNNSNSNNSNNNSQVTTNKDENTMQDTQNNSSTNILSGGTYKIPMKDIYIDTPNWQEIEQGFTELFIIHESKYVAITEAFESAATDVKSAHNETFKEFILNMQNYEGGVNSINITNEKETTIGDLKTYYFEGTINYGRDTIHDGYAIGYSFILGGTSYEIIGSVIDESQSAELIEEVSEVVNAMIKTVRTEK